MTDKNGGMFLFPHCDGPPDKLEDDDDDGDEDDPRPREGQHHLAHLAASTRTVVDQNRSSSHLL